jgi:hypothetical protein
VTFFTNPTLACQSLPEFFCFTLLSVAAPGDAARPLRPGWCCGVSIAIPSEQRESRGLPFLSRWIFVGRTFRSDIDGFGTVPSFRAGSSARQGVIRPFQIATRTQTKTSVTCSKQRIGILPNRYKIDNSFVASFSPLSLIIFPNFTRQSSSFRHTDEARRGVFARAVLPFPHTVFCDPRGIRGEWR